VDTKHLVVATKHLVVATKLLVVATKSLVVSTIFFVTKDLVATLIATTKKYSYNNRKVWLILKQQNTSLP